MADRKTKPERNTSRVQEFGRRFTQALEKAGYSQASFSRLVGYSRSAVHQYCSGVTYPSIDVIDEFAQILHVSPSWLLYGVEESKIIPIDKESIPVVQKTDGREEIVSSVTLTPEFLATHGLRHKNSLRAAAVFKDDELPGYKKGDIVIVDTQDQSVDKKDSKFLLDNSIWRSVGLARKAPDGHFIITTQGRKANVDIGQINIVGKVVAEIRGL